MREPTKQQTLFDAATQGGDANLEEHYQNVLSQKHGQYTFYPKSLICVLHMIYQMNYLNK